MGAENIIGIAASLASNAGVVSFRASSIVRLEDGAISSLSGTLAGNMTLCANDLCHSPGRCPMIADSGGDLV